MTCGKKHCQNAPTEATKVDHAEVEGRPLCDHPGCDKRVVGDGTRCADGHVQGQRQVPAYGPEYPELAWRAAEEAFAAGMDRSAGLPGARNYFAGAAANYQRVLEHGPQVITAADRDGAPAAVRVRSVDELKALAQGAPREFALSLSGGLRSGKTISYAPEEDRFFIWHEIDDTTQSLLTRNLRRLAPTIVGAIERGEFWASTTSREAEQEGLARVQQATRDLLDQLAPGEVPVDLVQAAQKACAADPPGDPETLLRTAWGVAEVRQLSNPIVPHPAARAVLQAVVEYYEGKARALRWLAQQAREQAQQGEALTPAPTVPYTVPYTQLTQAALGRWSDAVKVTPLAGTALSVVRGADQDGIMIENVEGPVLLTLLPRTHDTWFSIRRQVMDQLHLLQQLQTNLDLGGYVPVSIWPERELRQALRLQGDKRSLAAEPGWATTPQDREVAEGASLLVGQDWDAVVLDVPPGEVALVTLLPKEGAKSEAFRQKAQSMLPALLEALE